MTAGEYSSPRIMTLWEEMENCLPARLLNYHLACVLLILRYQLNTLSELIWLRAQNNAFTADLNRYLCIAAYICIFLYSLTLLPLPHRPSFWHDFHWFLILCFNNTKMLINKMLYTVYPALFKHCRKKQFIHLKLWHNIFLAGPSHPIKIIIQLL
jgi:hypothetical protein